MTDQEIFINEIKKREDFTVLTAREINLMWQSWQASANRQGYKLVPVEPTEEMVKAMKKGSDEGKHATWNYRCRLQYKMLIGAVECNIVILK